MSSKVKVAVRVRPFNRREIDLGTKCVVDMDDTQTILFSSASRDRKNTKTFAFDHCFWSMEESNNKYASQEKVYKCLGADVLENSFEGYNACIFAYGQTGSGKTYTMMGSQNQTGLIPRLCNELFDRISSNEDENITYKVEVSYIEIYNEKVRDLLCPRGNQATLRVREHKILGPYVEGLTKLVVSSFKDIENLMIEGNKSRTVAATNMNTESSRSHAVFNIVLTRSEYDKETEVYINPLTPKISLDIQLGGLGILQEHCQLDIEGNEVYVTPLAKTGTCVNGRLVEEKTQLKHGDRILWGNNHYFRINCPRLPGSEQQVEQTVDFQFAQTELMMNEMSAGPLKESVKALEEQYKAEKQGALDRQRQMYEEKIEELRNQMVPMGRQSMGERTVSIGSFSSGYGSSRMSWCDDSRENLIQFERKPLVLREEVIKANTLVREANQLSEEMGKETEFAVTLQIPTSSLSFGRSRPGFSSEVAIVVKHKSKGTQIWSLEKLSNKIYDMRDLYNQCVEDDIPFSETDENLDLFFEVECHTLIGVANVFLECLLHDVNHEYAAPIISQQGEVCGRLKVEVSRISEKAQKKKSREAEGDAGETSSDEEDDLLVIHDDNGDDDDDELVKGSQMHVEVKVVEAYDLPPALCNYVFCQYKFWNDDNTIVVPPINASISQPGPKTNTMIFEHKQLFDMQVTDEFVEYASEGSLAIEVWGNRMKGFDSQSKVMLNWNVEPQQKGLHDRWGELLRKMQLWVEILEINDQGVYAPVELHIQKDNLTGGVFQLRQGHSRRIVVRVQPVPRAGSLPVVCDIISAVYIGSVSMRTKNQQPLDSYQEKDLAILREKWSTSLMKRREYLDEQIHSLIDKQDKSASDKERESWMIDQWVCLTEERNAVLVPIRGSGIPGAPPLEGTVPLGMEKYNPVIFLDLQNDDVRSGCMEEGGPAGVDSTLVFENSDHMMELPIINYDQKQVSATVLWDSSIHDSVFLNRVTQSHERVYLILKIIVRLASPIAMDLVLRKRISVKIYKKQSWKDSLLRKITKDIITRSGVTYELVSHIPRQPGEETEERESLAQMAALAVGEGEEEDESVLRKYSKGISHVESLLALDRLRQEVMVKEKLAAIGKPLRKFASTPNLAAASGDLSFGFSGKDDRFDSPESHKLWNTRANNRSDFVLPGSFTDPRPIRPTKEEILLDLSQMNEKFSSSPTTSGVVLRNSGGGSSNSRPSSLLMELEPLEEDESTPAPSPQVRKNPKALFDFQETTGQGSSEGTVSPLSDELRERSGSADTLTCEDPSAPTASGEDLSNPPVQANDFKSISLENNLIDFASEKSSAKPSVGITLRGLDDALDDEEDEDELSSLLTQTQVEGEPLEPLGDSEEQNSIPHEKSNSSSREDLLGSFEGEDVHDSLDSLGDLKKGQVICIGDKKTGRIRYIGPTEFAPGVWIGVELDTPSGKNDGSVSGQRYFACKPRYGSFVKPEKVFPIDSVKREPADQKGLGRANSPTQSPVVMRKQTRDNRRKNEWKRKSNILF
ncbi:kinesin-like protein KIF13B [Pocillopora damicornis]|uniref:kinesin-like protein KIF13B n=1 Tax=Pocillopora damicornis TaxID=46731 RepID=UPI000F54E1AB|nr:kinesin-like protein KIF13B [Pocillopora damicornis]